MRRRRTSPFRGQRNFAGNTHLAALRISGTNPTGRYDGDLRRPATAERRHFGGEGGFGKIDLRRDIRIVRIDRQAGPGPGNTIVLRDGRALWQAGARVGGKENVHLTAGGAVLDHALIKIARRAGAAGGKVLAPGAGIAIYDNKTRVRGHRASVSPTPLGLRQAVDDLRQIAVPGTNRIRRRIVLVAVASGDEQDGLHA